MGNARSKNTNKILEQLIGTTDIKTLEELQQRLKKNDSCEGNAAGNKNEYKAERLWLKVKNTDRNTEHLPRTSDLDHLLRSESEQKLQTIADSFFHNRNFEQSIVVYSKLITRDQSNEIYVFNRGLSYYCIQRYHEGEKDFNKALLLDEHYIKARFYRGLIRKILNKPEAAVEDFIIILKRHPSHKRALFELLSVGDEVLSLDEYDLSIKIYSSALNLGLENADADLFIKRGHAFYIAERYMEADEDISKAIQLRKEDHELFYLRGLTKSKLHQIEEAIIDFYRALMFNEHNVNAKKEIRKIMGFQVEIPEEMNAEIHRALDCWKSGLSSEVDWLVRESTIAMIEKMTSADTTERFLDFCWVFNAMPNDFYFLQRSFIAVNSISDVDSPYQIPLLINWSSKYTNVCMMEIRDYHLGIGDTDPFDLFEEYDQTWYLSNYKFQQHFPGYIHGSLHQRLLLDNVAWIDCCCNNNDAIDVCIPSKIWPQKADEWIYRNRDFDWPAKPLISEIVRKCCTFVPVSDSKDTMSSLKWRISFHTAEKTLLCTLTPTQILLENIINLIVGEKLRSISQHICLKVIRHTLFWILEDTPQIVFKFDNLVFCMEIFLERLLSFIKRKHIPFYFLPSENLLDGNNLLRSKRNLKETVAVLRFLSDKLSYSVLSCVSIASKGHYLLSNETTLHVYRFCLDSLCSHLYSNIEDTLKLFDFILKEISTQLIRPFNMPDDIYTDVTLELIKETYLIVCKHLEKSIECTRLRNKTLYMCYRLIYSLYGHIISNRKLNIEMRRSVFRRKNALHCHLKY